MIRTTMNEAVCLKVTRGRWRKWRHIMQENTMTSLDHNDAIEIISSYDESTPITDPEYTMFTSLEFTSVEIDLPLYSQQYTYSEEKTIVSNNVLPKSKIPPPPPSKKEKRIKHAVMIVGTLLISMSLILVVVTLYMSDQIDEMGTYGTHDQFSICIHTLPKQY